MPGFISHYLFGLRLYDKMPEGELKRIIAKNKRPFTLGLQGPDLFFFHLPSVTLKGGSPGEVAHTKKTGVFLENLTRSCFVFNEKKDRQAALSYLAGFYAHYTLDRTCHPFIYARTAYHPHDPSYFSRHSRLETDIDADFLKKEKGILPSSYPWERTIMLNERQTQMVALMLNKAFKNTYVMPVVTRFRARTAISIYQKEIGYLMHDRHGTKRTVIEGLENSLMGHSYISGLIPQDFLRVHDDPANERKDFWKNPFEKDAPRQNDSFYELVDEATLRYQILIPYLTDLAGLRSAPVRFPDDISAGYSYSSGLPC